MPIIQIRVNFSNARLKVGRFWNRKPTEAKLLIIDNFAESSHGYTYIEIDILRQIWRPQSDFGRLPLIETTSHSRIESSDLKNVQLLLYDGGLIMRSLWKRHKTWLYYKNGILRRNWAGAAYTGLTQLWEKEIQQLKTPKKFHVTCVYVKKFYMCLCQKVLYYNTHHDGQIVRNTKKGTWFPQWGILFSQWKIRFPKGPDIL